MSYRIDFDAERHRYKIDGEPVPGVTSILKLVIDSSGPMSWWGMRIGLQGVLALATRYPDEEILLNTAEQLEKFIVREKLSTNHVRDQAGARGKGVHQAAENYAETQVIPDPQDFHPSERGYVRSLAHFLTEEQPEILDTEVIVGSKRHGYAGTYDTRGVLFGKSCLLDYKTSKRVYDSHHLQLAAYEVAAKEMGAEPTEAQYVIRLGEDGDYEVVESKATELQWLAALNHYRSLKELQESLKKRKKRVAA